MYNLAAALFGVFGGFMTLLVSWLGKKAAMSVALMAAYLAALGILWVSIKLLLGAIVWVLPTDPLAQWVIIGFNLVLPSNWEVCASAMVSADLLVFLYRFNQTRVVGAAAQG
jgi:hypothetical protein